MKYGLMVVFVVILSVAANSFRADGSGNEETYPEFDQSQGRARSWQSRVLEGFMILNRRFSQHSSELDVARQRAEVESITRMFKPMGAIESDPVVANGVPAEWIFTQGLRPTRVILHLHGGSFTSGSIASHRTLAGNVALAAGSRSLLIDYRLAPEHPFPAAVEDAVASYEWLLSQGFAGGQIVLVGDSAGGNLALALLVYLRDHHRPMPAAAVCLSPGPDLTFAGESWVFNSRRDILIDERMIRQAVDYYLNGADPRTPLASPYFADLRGLPPLLIQVGSQEVFLSDATRFAEKARQAGVEVTLDVWPGMQHVWHFAAGLMPESRRAIFRIGAFVETVFRKAE